MCSPSVSISATSTPSCDVPLIRPIANIEVPAGSSDAICSDMTLPGSPPLGLPHGQGLLHKARNLLDHPRRRQHSKVHDPEK
jgi:hypothetical protein